MQVVETIEALRAARRELAAKGAGRVGVVLTMGALHAGHLSLVERARAENDSVLATIFVNPLQFAANEDLNKYPRNLPEDLARFEAAGVDIVFTPTPALMYPEGYQTSVIVREVTQGLEGERRPNHFEGVATVVAKLFNLTQPHKTYFGQKDAQQVVVIKRMVRDLNFPLEVVICPTLRESTGLAMSSRNVYLSEVEREAAGSIYRAMRAAGERYEMGERHPAALLAVVRATLDPSLSVDYVSLNDPITLKPVTVPVETPILLSLTVGLGTTHLLDNCLLPFSLNDEANLSRILGG